MAPLCLRYEVSLSHSSGGADIAARKDAHNASYQFPESTIPPEVRTNAEVKDGDYHVTVTAYNKAGLAQSRVFAVLGAPAC